MIKVETYQPEHQIREVHPQEVPALYNSLGAASATFVWNDGGDDVLIVAVGGDYSTATIRRNSSFYDLEYSSAPGAQVIELAGDRISHPTALILPRQLGLELLIQMPEFHRIVDSYPWRVEV